MQTHTRTYAHMHFVWMDFFKEANKILQIVFTNWPLLFLVFIQICWLKVGYCVGTVFWVDPL